MPELALVAAPLVHMLTGEHAALAASVAPLIIAADADPNEYGGKWAELSYTGRHSNVLGFRCKSLSSSLVFLEYTDGL